MRLFFGTDKKMRTAVLYQVIVDLGPFSKLCSKGCRRREKIDDGTDDA